MFLIRAKNKTHEMDPRSQSSLQMQLPLMGCVAMQEVIKISEIAPLSSTAGFSYYREMLEGALFSHYLQRIEELLMFIEPV